MHSRNTSLRKIHACGPASGAVAEVFLVLDQPAEVNYVLVPPGPRVDASMIFASVGGRLCNPDHADPPIDEGLEDEGGNGRRCGPFETPLESWNCYSHHASPAPARPFGPLSVCAAEP